jgi:hypothetical protein
MAVRIAMWSGPRNISTALMRAWENREDSSVIDEPFYAHYLKITGLPHPGAEEVIANHESDPDKVIAWLTRSLPLGKTILYQKHMAHHLLPTIETHWLAHMINCFLIRDPREMLISLAKAIPNPRIEDTGLPQQVDLFLRENGRTDAVPIVLDARDVLLNPEGMLRQWCERIGVSFSERMLHWPAGPRDSDGVWGKHWYDAVWRSTGFEPYRPKAEPLPGHLRPLLDACMKHYDLLHAHRIH